MERPPLAALDGRLRFLREPGPWLWIALAVGAAARGFLVVATDGTDDVPIWQSHAGWTVQYGLVGYYEWQEVMNHPPFVAWLHAHLWQWARAWDVPFRIPLRALYALVDLGTAALLALAFRGSPLRWVVAAGYWLNPLAIVFSAYHGNTDSAVAFAALAAVLLAAEGRALAAGVALGVGAWIKLPVTLALFPILFFLPGTRSRLLFAGSFLVVGASTYLPVALRAWDLLYARVLAYPGLHIHTPGGVPVWGIWHVLGGVESLPARIRLPLRDVVAWHEAHNRLVTLLPIALLAWLRRGERGVRGLGTTVCGGYLLFYGLTNFWAWQYLAWLLPFLYLAGPGFVLAGTAVLGGFIVAAYVTFTGSPLLLGKWDFNAYRTWPAYLMLLRDASVLFCFGGGVALLAGALRDAWTRARRAGAGEA